MARRHDNGDELPTIRHRFGQRLLSTSRVAGSALRLAGRGLLRSPASRDASVDAAIGERLARELDGMKGLAMKIGQILSYFDGILPEQTHAALRALQQGARPVAFETMRPVLEQALGAPVSSLFERFDTRAVAAASIGQVYRARYEGRDVAVKVQYPNVRKTLTADFSKLRRLAGLASLATAVDGRAFADELKERVIEECDYRLEAHNQQAFARAFADVPRVRIPEVIAARSAETVLTTAWHEGQSFYEMLDSAPAARRDASALLLARFGLRSLFSLGAINADPHPGNYIFPALAAPASPTDAHPWRAAAADDSVVFLDFGCVRRFDEDYLELERRLAHVVIDDRREDFRDALLATGQVRKVKRFDFDAHWAMLCHQYAPYRETPFRFTREYMQAGVELSGPGNPNLRRLAIPPPWIWQTRLLWGLHAVLTRMSAEGDFASTMRAALAERVPFPG